MARLVTLLLIVLVAMPAPLLAWVPRCLPEPSPAAVACVPPACVVVATCREILGCPASSECPQSPCGERRCLPRDCQGCAIFVTYFCQPETLALAPVRQVTSLSRSLAERAQARRERPLLPPPK